MKVIAIAVLLFVALSQYASARPQDKGITELALSFIDPLGVFSDPVFGLSSLLSGEALTQTILETFGLDGLVNTIIGIFGLTLSDIFSPATSIIDFLQNAIINFIASILNIVGLGDEFLALFDNKNKASILALKQLLLDVETDDFSQTYFLNSGGFALIIDCFITFPFDDIKTALLPENSGNAQTLLETAFTSQAYNVFSDKLDNVGNYLEFIDELDDGKVESLFDTLNKIDFANVATDINYDTSIYDAAAEETSTIDILPLSKYADVFAVNGPIIPILTLLNDNMADLTTNVVIANLQAVDVIHYDVLLATFQRIDFAKFCDDVKEIDKLIGLTVMSNDLTDSKLQNLFALLDSSAFDTFVTNAAAIL